MNFQIGQAVTWMYTPRGGYGYTTPVKAIITRIAKSKVQIEVTLVRLGNRPMNEKQLKWVKPENIRAN